MRTGLFFLANLSDQDIDWLAGAGGTQFVRRGEALVRQGSEIECLYFVVQGSFEVTTSTAGHLADIKQGELIGEISFLDSRPPTATVTAVEDATVLAIPRSRLQTKLGSDKSFASHFYRSLGVMLAHRIRDLHLEQVGGAPGHAQSEEEIELPGEFAIELLEQVNLAAVRLEALLNRVGVR